MIGRNRNKDCVGFMVAMAVVAVLLALLMFFAWSRKRNNPKPESPVHAATDTLATTEKAT